MHAGEDLRPCSAGRYDRHGSSDVAHSTAAVARSRRDFRVRTRMTTCRRSGGCRLLGWARLLSRARRLAGWLAAEPDVRSPSDIMRLTPALGDSLAYSDGSLRASCVRSHPIVRREYRVRSLLIVRRACRAVRTRPTSCDYPLRWATVWHIAMDPCGHLAPEVARSLGGRIASEVLIVRLVFWRGLAGASAVARAAARGLAVVWRRA